MDQEHPLNTSMQSMLLWISSGRGVLYANSAFCNYVGLPIEQLVGLDPRQLVEFTTGDVAEFFANPLSSAIPNRLLADNDGRIFEIKTAARDGMMDVVLDEVSGDRPLQEFLSKVSGTPFEDLAEEELRTARIPDFRFITCCAARLKPVSALASKIPPLEHRIMTGVFLEETTKPLLSHGCTVLPSRGSLITGFAGAPRYHADHSIRALEAAFEQLWRIQRVRENCNNEGREIPPVSCGIASGNSIVGGFGSGPTAAYLAEGDCVEIAELLSRIAAPGEILISASTLDHIIANLDPQWQAFEGEAEEEVDLSAYAVHAGSVIPLEGTPRIISICEVVPEGVDQPSPTYIFQEIWRLLEGDSGIVPVFRAFRPVDSAAPRTQGNAVLESGYVTRLGRYRLSEVIGSGGMGRVWKGQDAYGNTVAIKTLHSSTAESPESIRRFRREAEVMSRIPHRNICRIFEAGEHDGAYFLVMEYVEGLTLSDILHPDTVSTASHSGKSTDLPSLIAAVRKNRSSIARPSDAEDEAGQAPDSKVSKPRQGYAMPVEQAISLMEKICEAVEFAHQHGILHRDLKPGNILLRADGEPLVADFGLAKLSGETGAGDGPSLSLSGQVVGTVENMAPEQAESSKGVDARADVYALGTILYQMCTGRKHFTASGNLIADFQALQNHEPLRPRAIRPTLDADLEVIIMKCLRSDPAERYRSVSALLADLQRFRQGDPITARPVTIFARSRKFVRRHKFATIASTLLIVAASLVGIQFQTIQKNRAAAAAKEEEDRERQVRSILDNHENQNPATVPASLALALRMAQDKKPIAQKLLGHLLKSNFALPFAIPSSAMEGYDFGVRRDPPKISVERRNDGTLVVDSPEENFKSKPFPDATQKLPAAIIPEDSEIKYYYDPVKKTLGQLFKKEKTFSIIFYDLKDGEPLGPPLFFNSDKEPWSNRFTIDESASMHAFFSPDGNKFIFPARGRIFYIPIFDLNRISATSADVVISNCSYYSGITEVQISNSGNFANIINSSGSSAILDLNSMNRSLEEIPKLSPNTYFFSADEKSLVSKKSGNKDSVPEQDTICFDLRDRSARVDEIKMQEFTSEKAKGEKINPRKFFSFFPDGTRIAISGANGKIVIWDLENSTTSKIFEAGSPVLAITVSPNGSLLAAGCLDGKVHIWNVSTGVAHSSPIEIGAPASAVTFGPNNQSLAVGSMVGELGKMSIKLWDLKSQKDVFPVMEVNANDNFEETSDPRQNRTEAAELSKHIAQISEIEFSADGRFLLARDSYNHNNVTLLDIPSTTKLPLPDGRIIYSAAFSPDGKSIAYCLQNKDGADLGIIRSLQEKGNEIKLYPNSKTLKYRNLKFSQNGQYICLYGDEISTFEASNGKMIWSKSGNDVTIAPQNNNTSGLSLAGGFSNAIFFNPAGTVFVEIRKAPVQTPLLPGMPISSNSGGHYYSIIRDASNGVVLSTRLNHNDNPQAEFSPNGKWIAAGTRNSLKLESWIELDDDIPEWFADFAEVYSGFRRGGEGNSFTGIQPEERISNLSEILNKIQNNNDTLSHVVKWLTSTERDRTQSPYSLRKVSDEHNPINDKHVFEDFPHVKLEGSFIEPLYYWDESGAKLRTKDGIWSVKLPSTSLSGIFSHRNVRFKGEVHRGPENPVITIKDWGDIEDLPVEGEVILVSPSKSKKQKRLLLHLKKSDGNVLKILLDFNITNSSETILKKLVGRKILVFSRDSENRSSKYIHKILNPMDISFNGLPLGYQLDESSPEFQTQSFYNSIQPNGEIQSVHGTASFFCHYPSGELELRTGFYSLETTMNSGEKVGLIISQTDKSFDKDYLYRDVLENLVGKKISARGRGFKLFGRPQILIQSLKDLKVIEGDGKLSNPCENVIFSELLRTFSGYNMQRVVGRVLRFEPTNKEGLCVLDLQPQNGSITKVAVNLSVIKDLSEAKLSSLVGKQIAIFGERTKSLSADGKNVYSVQVKDARDIKVIKLPESATESIPQNYLGKSGNSRDTTRFESANQF